MDSRQADAIARLTADWLLGNLKAPRPAPVATKLTCAMSFVVLPGAKTSDGVCFRHYQAILQAAGAHRPAGSGNAPWNERTSRARP